MPSVTATEFARNFGRFREEVQREPIAITSHGRTTGYFLSAHDYAEYQRLKAQARQVFHVSELPDDVDDAIEATRMDPEHDALNRLLDPPA